MSNRKCIVTKKIYEPNEMIRFVCGPDQNIYPDINNRLPGRGAWIYGQQSLVAEAIDKKLFARNFKKEVIIAKDMAQLIDQLLYKQALGALAMVRKAGKLRAGSLQVIKASKNKHLYLVLHNEDAALAGKEKIAQALRARKNYGFSKVKLLTLFNSDELSQVFKDRTIMHIALFTSSVAENFVNKVKKLQFYRGNTIKNTALAIEEI